MTSSSATDGEGNRDVGEPRRKMTVRDFEPGDEYGIQALFHQTFGPRSMEEWRWEYERAPLGHASIVVAVDDDGRIIGHMARVPAAGWIQGRPARLATSCDAMVAADWQGMRVYGRVNKAMTHVGDFDARLTFPTDQMDARARRWGRSQVGRLPQWIRKLRPVLGPATLSARAVAGLAPRRPVQLVSSLSTIAPHVDELSEASASFAPALRRRDVAYLQWRWFEQPGRHWQLTAAFDDDQHRLAGFAIWGTRGGKEGEVGVVGDLLARDAATTTALLVDASRRLAASGHQLVTFEYQDPRPWAARACWRAGFVARGLGPNVGVRVLSSSTADGLGEIEQLTSWYLTLGDTDLA